MTLSVDEDIVNTYVSSESRLQNHIPIRLDIDTDSTQTEL
jgi:hypothetical protein